MSHPWYRLHPLTWAVLLVIGSSLMYGQFLCAEQHLKALGPSYSLGWPRSYAKKWSPSGPLVGLDRRSLAIDVGWWFAMITPPLILSERLARRRFRFSLKALLGTFAAAHVLLSRTDWLHFRYLVKYQPSRLVLELALLAVTFCCVAMMARAVIGVFTTIWNRSASAFTRVASYLLICLAALGVYTWLHSRGFFQADEGIPVLLVGVGLLLTLGLLAWLSSLLAGLPSYFWNRLDPISRFTVKTGLAGSTIWIMAAVTLHAVGLLPSWQWSFVAIAVPVIGMSALFPSLLWASQQPKFSWLVREWSEGFWGLLVLLVLLSVAVVVIATRLLE